MGGYALLAFLALLSIWLGYNAWNRTHGSEAAQAEVTRIADSIQYFDEVLTMSARVAMLNYEPRWESRYEEALRALQASLSRARVLSPYAKDPLAQIEAANQRLVAQELRAFQYVREGKTSEGVELLGSATYEADKSSYAEGLRLFVAGLRDFQSRSDEALHREVFGFEAAALALLSFMGFVLYSNHRLLVRRIELEQLLGVIAHRLIATGGAELDGEIQSVLRLLSVRARATQVWLLQQHRTPLPRLVNSWYHAGRPGEQPDPRSTLNLLLEHEADESGMLALEASHEPALASLGIQAIEGVSLESGSQRFVLALLGTADNRLRWSHREAAVLRSIGEVLIRSIENRKLQEQLLQQATTDGLTGLVNRRQFTELLQRACSRAGTAPLPTAVLMLDIDHFKAINDRHGHAAGDAVLVHLAGLLREHLRDIDVVARIGGEEFAALLPSTDFAGAMDAAERLREKIAGTAVVTEGKHIPFTISIGVSLIARPEPDAGAALKRADQALYAAKQAGRNCVRQCLATLPATT